MPRYKFMVMTRPVPGREDEYNHWYQNVHLPQLVQFPGVTAAQRYRAHTSAVEGEPWPYLCVYELETDDPGALLGKITAAAGNNTIDISDAIDADSAYAVVYEEFGEKVITA